jgi:quinol monooxygenase YgiN
MRNNKVIVLAEIPVRAEHVDAVIALSDAALEPTLAEPGCEIFYQTRKKDEPNTLVFFEVFKSKEALDVHMQAAYTKNFFTGVEGKLAGKPVSTVLQQL